MKLPASTPPSALCTFAVRDSDGRYLVDPTNAVLRSHSVENAYVWLWPLGSEEARLADLRVAVPGIGSMYRAVRARP